MITRIALSVLLALCMGYSRESIAATAIATSSPVAGEQYGSTTPVRSVVALRLDEITPDQTWVIARVKPNPGSPAAKGVGFYFDSRTLQFVQEPGMRPHTVVREWGTIEPIIALSGIMTLPTSYSWEYDDNPRVSLSQVSIFSGGAGGTAIFRVNEGEAGNGKFKPAYVIDDKWVPFVQPALKYVQQHKGAFDAEAVSEYREQLQQLLSDPNPFLAIAAARTLSEAHQLDAAFVQGPLTQSKGLEQSVFAFLFIQQLPRDKRLDLGEGQVTPQEMNDAVAKAITGEAPVEELGQFIDSAKDAETLQAVTIGLAALLDSRDSSIFTEARVEGLLRHVVQRQKTLNTHTEADAYLNASPVLMGLRQPLKATNAPK